MGGRLSNFGFVWRLSPTTIGGISGISDTSVLKQYSTSRRGGRGGRRDRGHHPMQSDSIVGGREHRVFNGHSVISSVARLGGSHFTSVIFNFRNARCLTVNGIGGSEVIGNLSIVRVF